MFLNFYQIHHHKKNYDHENLFSLIKYNFTELKKIKKYSF